MNEEEAEALTGENDPLLASDKALDWVDLVLCTAGPAGLYMAGFTEEEVKRKTQHPLLPGAIAEFNSYHRSNVPNSSKHKFTWLTYSSLAQVCKYANRVSYQVLNQHSPRLTRGLPEREDSLEESYWDR